MAMPRQASMRNQRGKGGFKPKYFVQFFVLVAICIWLLYQVKHSQDKKKAFEEKGSKASAESRSEAFSFGRKDIPRTEERDPAAATATESASDEEGDGDGNELPGEEQEAKPTEIEEEEEERGAEEDQDMGGGWEEEEEGHGEGFGGRGDEEKEDRVEATDSSDGQDTSKDTQEAREEQYRGDDVASAAHRGAHALDSELVMEDGASEEETNEDGEEDKGLGTEDLANATAIGDSTADAMVNEKPDVNGTAMAETNGSEREGLVSEEKPPLDSAEVGSVESQGGNSTEATESQGQMERNSEAETATDSTDQSEVQSSSAIDFVTNQEQHHKESATSLAVGGDVSSTAEEQTQEVNSSNEEEYGNRNVAANENSGDGGLSDGPSRAGAIADDNAIVAAIADLSKSLDDQTGAQNM